MSRALIRILAVLVPLTLTACMQDLMSIRIVNPFAKSADDSTIDKYTADKQYGRAIKALEERIQQEPTRQAKAKLVEVATAARNFEKDIIHKAQLRTKTGKWQSAFVIVDEALQSYPESRRLVTYRESLSGKQHKGVVNARVQLDTAKADYLLRIRPVYQELNRLDPKDSDIQWKLKKTLLEISETAKSMSLAGQQGIKYHDYETAQHYLELADQLDPTPENTKLLAHLAQVRMVHLEKKNKAKIDAQRLAHSQPLTSAQKVQQEKFKFLTQRISNAIRRGDFDSASQMLTQAQGIAHDHPEFAKLRLSLDSSVNQKVTQLVHRGNELYSKGRIEQARSSWDSALKLDPNNEQVKSSVERADRVLSKLKEIKSRNSN